MPPQAPAVQTSPVVHRLLSLQVVPSVALARPQAPLVALQVATWHALPAGQTLAVPPHTPAVQHIAAGAGAAVVAGRVVGLGASAHRPVAGTQALLWH